MMHRRFGRTDWQVSEIGYGTWGMGGWTDRDDREALQALGRAVDLGCNFFDTAWIYGDGHSERLLGQVLAEHRDKRLAVATKVPPKNLRWPARREYRLDEVFPTDHIREYTERSLSNLGVERIDLQQLHIWNDTWAEDERWQRAADDLKRQGLIEAFGISVNRWEPTNVVRALRTGVVDSVQVVYNIFDQAPEDELFSVCREYDVAVIARVPFDEGSLSGAVRSDSRWPDHDWRNLYFTPDNLKETIVRVERLKQALPRDVRLPDLALRFILEEPTVSTVIPGMRKVRHVEQNLSASDGMRLPDDLLHALRQHRWDRSAVIE